MDLAGDRLDFETLISDISARLMAQPPDGLDEAIEAAFERVRLFFRGDRCGLLTVSDDATSVRITHRADPEFRAFEGDINLVARFPWVSHRLLTERQPVVVDRVADLPPEAALDRATFELLGTRSQCTVPIVTQGRVRHLVVLGAVREERIWPPAYLLRLRLLGEIVVSALDRKQAFVALRESEEQLRRDVMERRRREEELAAALAELRRLQEQLQSENLYLREETRRHTADRVIEGRSPAIRRALALAEQVAPTTATVLLTGETGTGKERFATLIHEASPRRGRTMVRVNCSAIPTALIESELFGREKGAYTGALSRQVGRFEIAHGSTLFLDEVSDLPLEVQVKLLRVLQEHTIERLGSPRPIPVDVRIVAATNRELEAAVRQGTFRSDLYYRLNVFPILVPPLRERREDIPVLVATLVDEIGAAMGKRFDAVSKESLAALQEHEWPGNVRELRNIVERAMIVSAGPILRIPPALLPGVAANHAPPAAPASRLDQVERDHILRVLGETGWRIKGAGSASERLGLKPSTLYFRLKKLGITRPTA